MPRDRSDNNTNPLVLTSHFRGLYNRVAVAVDVDPSYVSRVARGERSSEIVEEALKKEIKKILGKTQFFNGDGHADGNGRLDGDGATKKAANRKDSARRSRK
jgi:hypothetical protein